MCNVYVAVVGDKEKASQTVNVRTRDNVVHGELSIHELLEKFKSLAESHVIGEDTI